MQRRNGKPGMGKYASFRGPGRNRPVEEQRAFWEDDLAREMAYLREDIASNDVARAKRTSCRIAEVRRELDRIAAQEVAQREGVL